MVFLDTKPGTWAPEEYPPRLIFFDEYRLDQISHSEKAYDKVNKTKCDTCVPTPEEKNTLASLFFWNYLFQISEHLYTVIRK